MGQGVLVFRRTTRFQRTRALGITRSTGPIGGRLGVLGAVCCQRVVQHIPGRRIPAPGCAATQDEGRVWQMGLVGEWCALWYVSSAPALGNTREYRQCYLLGILPGQALPSVWVSIIVHSAQSVYFL